MKLEFARAVTRTGTPTRDGTGPGHPDLGDRRGRPPRQPPRTTELTLTGQHDKSQPRNEKSIIFITPCENLLRAPNTRHVAPSRDLVRPGEATRGSRCAGRSALRAQASAHRLARIMSCQFDVRDDLDHQTLAAFESTSTSGRSPVRVRREHVAPEASWKARLAERLHFCCSCEQ